MLNSGKLVALIGIAIFCLLVTVATFAFTLPVAKPAIQAAPAAQATPVADPTKPASPPTKTEAKPVKEEPAQGKAAPANDPYLSEFNKVFAAKLGVSEDALTTAFAGAISDTLDKMVKDGKLTADQAAKFKSIAAKGPAGMVALPGLKGGDVNGSPVENPKELFGKALPEIAKLFNMSFDQLDAAMQGGKSLSDLAVAAKVEVQKVKDTLLASFKSQLDEVVKVGKLTQTDADNILKKLTPFIDDFVSSKPGVKLNDGIYDKLLGDTTWQVVAQLLNMPVATLKEQVNGQQTIVTIAKSKQIDEATVRTTVENSLKAQLEALVSKGEISKEVGDQASKDLSRLVSKFIGAPLPGEK